MTVPARRLDQLGGLVGVVAADVAAPRRRLARRHQRHQAGDLVAVELEDRVAPELLAAGRRPSSRTARRRTRGSASRSGLPRSTQIGSPGCVGGLHGHGGLRSFEVLRRARTTTPDAELIGPGASPRRATEWRSVSSEDPSCCSPSSRPSRTSRSGCAAGYLTDDAIATTVFLADRLGKPLLVEGPAGVGKTELAKAVATATGSELIRLQCYEGLDEARALYEWNYKKQLLRIQAVQGRRRVGRDPRRHLHRGVPARPAAADGDPARGPDRPAHRRDRQGRRRGRGPAARGAVATSR